MTDVADITTGVDFIVAGFVHEQFPLLLLADQKGRISVRESFATVGEGEYPASSVLIHRAHDELNSLGDALYHVYEAKKYAERVRSVGKATSLMIVMPNNVTSLVTTEGRAFLDRRFEEFGPKAINPETFEMPAKYFSRDISGEEQPS